MQQLVEKLNGEYFNLIKFFEHRYIDMTAFSDVQEHTIQEKQKRFNVQILAPWQTQIKKELTESFILDDITVCVHILPSYIYFPIFIGTFLSRLQLKVEYQTFLYADVKV